MRLLFLGPPGSGKSTIVKRVSELHNVVVWNLDTVVARRFAASSPQPELPLQQTFIAAAVHELIAETAYCAQCIVELPYHDYKALINEHESWFRSFEQVIAIFAPIQVLLARNALRYDPIPEPYIIECSDMLERSRPNLRSWFGTKYNEIDTGQIKKDESLYHVIRLISVPDNYLREGSPTAGLSE